VRGNNSVQDRQACGAGVRQGSEDEISLWRVAAFEPVKTNHFSTVTHTPARDDYPGPFVVLGQSRWITEYGPAVQA